MTTPINPRDLRVSDAERTHVVDVLQKAIGVGLLSLDEFTSRTDTALAARTRGELNAVLVDLPGLVNAENEPEAARPLEIRASMSTVRRQGAWQVPRALSVHNRAGTVDLDFTEARITDPVITIDVNLAMGTVELLIPDTATCDLRVETAVGGSVRDRGPRHPAATAGPRFVITGTVKAGSLNIHRPTLARLGPLVIGRRWKITWTRPTDHPRT